MSEQQITIVRDNSSSEVKVFVGGELHGRYKDDSTALAHLATALVELTAAQQRVAEFERSRDAWEKHYNEMSNKKDADIHRLEIERELLEKRELALRTQLVALYSCRQPDPGIADWYTIRITKAHAERIMEALTK